MKKDPSLTARRNDRLLQMIPVAGAALGATAAVMTTSATSVLGMIGMGMMGAIGGGFFVPAIGMTFWFAGKALIKTVGEAGPVLVAGAAMLAAACANILFVKPFKALSSQIKKLLPEKKEQKEKEQTQSPAQKSPSPLKDKTAQTDFTKSSEKTPETKPASAPVPKTPPKP